jgi:uracil-DNA glycosylase
VGSSVRRNGAPFTTRTGRRLLYMWNPTTGEHAYYDVTNDVFLSADEATAALAMH